MNTKTRIKLPEISERYGFIILRAILGLIFISHGIARVYYQSISDFGGFLDSKGLLIGVQIAWMITIGEIISGSLLIVGIKVKYCVLFHAVIITTGIFFVHLSNGWFVVGHGNNGIEYSVLILAVLLFIYSRSSRQSQS